MEDQIVNGVRYQWKPSDLPAPLDNSHWDGGALGGRIEKGMSDEYPFMVRGRDGGSRGAKVFVDAAVIAQRWARADYDRQVKFVAEYAAALQEHGVAA